MGPSKPDRRAPKSGPRPRLPRLLPCTCGNFRWVRDVPRWLPGNPFGSESLREVAGTESRRDRPSVHVERNDRPVRGGGGAQSCLHNGRHTTARYSGKHVLVAATPEATPCSSRHLCAARGESAAGAGSSFFWVFAFVEAAYHICGVCTGRFPDGAAARARRGPPGDLVAGQPGDGGVFVGGSSGAVARRSRAPPFRMRGACGRAIGAGAAQQVELCLLERGDMFSWHFSVSVGCV
jgi:hypothetical protein